MKDQAAYLSHIVDAIQDIQLYAAVGRDAFLSDSTRQDAVLRKLEIIGEAVKHLSEAVKNSPCYALAQDRRNAPSADARLLRRGAQSRLDGLLIESYPPCVQPWKASSGALPPL